MRVTILDHIDVQKLIHNCTLLFSGSFRRSPKTKIVLPCTRAFLPCTHYGAQGQQICGSLLQRFMGTGSTRRGLVVQDIQLAEFEAECVTYFAKSLWCIPFGLHCTHCKRHAQHAWHLQAVAATLVHGGGHMAISA